MHLRVHCPNGCLIRLPSSRAGKKIRCSECKATLQLPNVPDSERLSGKPIPLDASLAKNDVGLVNQDDGLFDEPSAPERPDDHSLGVPTQETPGAEPNRSGEWHDDESEQMAILSSQPQVDVASAKLQLETDQNLPVFPSTDFAMANSNEDNDSGSDDPSESNMPEFEGLDFSTLDVAPREVRFDQISKSLEPHSDAKLNTGPAIDSDGNLTTLQLADVKSSGNDLVAQQKRDHKTLARFYGFCIAALGLISLVPAVIMLVKINQADMTAMTPRWIYLLMFVGSLHLVYAVYLIQIADWSSLWAVSILMLVASFFYGVFSTAIVLDDGFGPVVSFLQLTVSQIRTASIGCLVGLCFSVLTSYLCGREALHWRRNEQRLFEIARQRKKSHENDSSATSPAYFSS